jgi:hypothetical protein
MIVALGRAQTRFRPMAQRLGHTPPLALGRPHPVFHCIERYPKPPGQRCRRALTVFMGHQHPLTQIRRIGQWHDTLHRPRNPAEKDGRRSTSFRHTDNKPALVLQPGFILKFLHCKDRNLLVDGPDIPSEVDGTRWISEVEEI